MDEMVLRGFLFAGKVLVRETGVNCKSDKRRSSDRRASWAWVRASASDWLSKEIFERESECREATRRPSTRRACKLLIRTDCPACSLSAAKTFPSQQVTGKAECSKKLSTSIASVSHTTKRFWVKSDTSRMTWSSLVFEKTLTTRHAMSKKISGMT